jgi:hypothetical protein
MRAPTPLHLAIILFIIAAALLVLIATHKTKAVVVPTERSAIAEEDNFEKYIDEVEKQNALERDQKEQAEKLANLAKARKDSVECQFWTQQKQKHSANKRVEEKITQFCELPPTTDTSAADTSSADNQGSAK